MARASLLSLALYLLAPAAFCGLAAARFALGANVLPPVGDLALAVGTLAAVALGYGFASWSMRQQRVELRQALASLGRAVEDEATAGSGASELPSLPAQHAWAAEFEQVRALCVQFLERVATAVESRMRLEVRSQRALHERDRLSEIMASWPDPVLAVEEGNSIALANEAAEKLLGLEGTPAETRSLERIEHCQQLLELLEETRRRRSPSPRVAELELADPAGNRNWYSVSCRASGNAEERATASGSGGTVAVLRNIGNQKAVQKRHAEFVAAVSHEMKTPLASIKAYTELLADGEADDEATRDEFLGVIATQADRLRRLIDNLLNLARIEAGVVQVQKQPISLNEVAEEAYRVLQHAATEKHISLQTDLSEMHLAVLADRDLLLQTVINLLSNGIKYTPAQGTVTLRSRLVDSTVEFEVEDTGVGLSTEDQARVFEKFYRVKKDASMAQGTGLGLPLVKHIVEDVHGGSITLTSQPGQGSTFRVSLPRALSGECPGTGARLAGAAS